MSDRGERSGAVVIGLGNPLMGDDGLGLAALERLRERWALPSGVELMDGGTWGMALLPAFEGATEVLLLDAIDAAAEPGTAVRLEGDAIPAALSLKLSPHQIDLREVIAIMQLRGTTPPRLVALGAQPATFQSAPAGSPEDPWADGLSPAVAAAVDALVDAAAAQLAAWGHAVTPLEPALQR